MPQTTLDNIYAAVSREVKDANLDKLTFIQNLNNFLIGMNLTKPAEQVSNIFFLQDFEKYKVPTGFREPIALYSEQVPMIRYVSPLRYRLQDPPEMYTDQSINGTRFLKVLHPNSSSQVTVATQADDLTADGTWAISGGTNLAIDTITKKFGGGSLSFTVNSAQSILTFTKTAVIDTSPFTEFLRERFYAWLPTAPTNIKIRIGNDASNYYEQTVTTQASGEKFDTLAVNELEFSQENSTKTGTIDRTKIDWFQFELNFSVAINVDQFRLNHIMIGKPEPLDFEWYTSYIGQNSTGDLISIITEDINTTDQPIIQNYQDYINTIVNGLVYNYLAIPDPERAKQYYTRYVGEKDPNNKYINGLGYLDMRYPSRRASYKRIIKLPDLNYNVGQLNQGIYRNDD